MYNLNQVLTTLFGQLRQVQTNADTIAVRVQTEVRFHNCFFDILQNVFLPRLNNNHARFRYGYACHLSYRCRGTVVINHNLLQQRGSCTASTQACQIHTQSSNGFFHLALDTADNFINCCHYSLPPTRVPIFSPAAARRMLPGSSILNTTIGMLLSMHRLIAVESITLR